MLKYQNKDIIEVGIDECARGVLFGRIYSAAVIYPLDKVPLEIENIINDSKKLSAKKRELIYKELIKHVKYNVSYIENATNISQTRLARRDSYFYLGN